jgi:TM2 domain-containing membrane protein YozV
MNENKPSAANDEPVSVPARPPAKTAPAVAEHHDISVALLAGMIFPGGGQFYNGQAAKAITLLVVFLAGLAVSLWLMSSGYRTVALLTAGCGVLLWFAALIDAAIVANRLKRREPVGLWRCF